MPSRRLLTPLATLALAGCGAIGDLQPPTLDIPRPVTDLRAVEQVDKVLINFTIPELTTEGTALRLAKVELKAGEELLDTAGMKPGPAHLELEAARWTGQEVSFRVRLFSHKGRDSGWSEPAALKVVPPLETPSGFRAEAVAEGVRLAWTGPREPAEVTFRIRRGTAKGAAAEVATVRGRGWVDTDTRFGETYEYSLQAVILADPVRAEGAASPPLQITPIDRFPPAVPKGLTGMAASSSIELSWDPNGESDLRGYNVYRASGDQAWQRVAEAAAVPSYSDRDVKPSIVYRYAVSSVDLSGNESDRSETVEVMVP
jgi:hypothetical protein